MLGSLFWPLAGALPQATAEHFLEVDMTNLQTNLQPHGPTITTDNDVIQFTNWFPMDFNNQCKIYLHDSLDAMPSTFSF